MSKRGLVPLRLRPSTGTSPRLLKGLPEEVPSSHL